MIKRLLLLLLCLIECQFLLAAALLRTISVFKPDETEYHKYSAILAATEPLRVQCDEEIKKNVNPLVLLFHQLKGVSVKDPTSSIRIENKQVDNLCLKYEQQVEDIVKSYGMDISTFNNMSTKMATEPLLKQKVVLQAYYYRIATDLESNTRKELPVLPAISDSDRERQHNLLRMPVMSLQSSSSQDSSSSSGSGSRKGTSPAAAAAATMYSTFAKPAATDSKFDSFCKVLRNVELVRIRMRDHLQASLGVSHLPACMCDADVLPAMSPAIQSACAAFPRSAAALIAHHGLETTEFNALQDKVKSDVLFRWRVQRMVDKLDKEISSSSGSNGKSGGGSSSSSVSNNISGGCSKNSSGSKANKSSAISKTASTATTVAATIPLI